MQKDELEKRYKILQKENQNILDDWHSTKEELAKLKDACRRALKTGDLTVLKPFVKKHSMLNDMYGGKSRS